jgi:hypothetical protein
MGMLAETLRDHDMAHLIPDAVRGRLREMGNTARAIT